MELLFFVTAILPWVPSLADILPATLHPFHESMREKFQFLRNHGKFDCPNLQLHEAEGVISSPFYPTVYPSHLSCTWHIEGKVGDLVAITISDLDIEDDTTRCDSPPCCVTNWLKIGPLVNGSRAIFCGKGNSQRNFLSATNKLEIKFQISDFIKGGRGFTLRYKLMHNLAGSCRVDEFMCHSKKCIPGGMRCNGAVECEDHSDERNCANRCSSGRSCRSELRCYGNAEHCNGAVDCKDFSDESDCGFCLANQTWCGGDSMGECYDPLTQRCDRAFDCLNGADETDCYTICPGKLMCDSHGGCYTMQDRCNGITQCEDASDEKHCVPELCNYARGGFLCDNGRCIRQVWTCDRTDDCGDGSDERNCLRNSVLTAALMGSLICALLLVIAVSCTCRLHALRMAELRTSRGTPLSRLSQEFLFREPPPPYSVAVQGDPPPGWLSRRSRPRRPRHSRSRRPPPRSLPPPPIPPSELLDDASVTATEVTDQHHHQQIPPSNIPQSRQQRQKTTADDPIRPDHPSVHTGGRSKPVACEVPHSQGRGVSDREDSQVVESSDTAESASINLDVIFVSGPDSGSSHLYCDSDTDPLV